LYSPQAWSQSKARVSLHPHLDCCSFIGLSLVGRCAHCGSWDHCACCICSGVVSMVAGPHILTCLFLARCCRVVGKRENMERKHTNRKHNKRRTNELSRQSVELNTPKVHHLDYRAFGRALKRCNHAIGTSCGQSTIDPPEEMSRLPGAMMSRD